MHRQLLLLITETTRLTDYQKTMPAVANRSRSVYNTVSLICAVLYVGLQTVL